MPIKPGNRFHYVTLSENQLQSLQQKRKRPQVPKLLINEALRALGTEVSEVRSVADGYECSIPESIWALVGSVRKNLENQRAAMVESFVGHQFSTPTLEVFLTMHGGLLNALEVLAEQLGQHEDELLRECGL